MKRFIILTALSLFCLPLNACYMHHHNPQIDQVFQAKRAEAIYAHKLEKRYHKLLSHLVPSEALHISVSVELDFSQSKHTHITAPDEIGLLAESESAKTHEKGNVEEFSEEAQSRKYLAAQHRHEVIDYPGRLKHLGVAVLIVAVIVVRQRGWSGHLQQKYQKK